MKTTKLLCTLTFLLCFLSIPAFIGLALYTGKHDLGWGCLGAVIIGFLALCGVEDVERRES